VSNSYSNILKKIEDRTVKIGVLGLGYVGLPLAVTFALKETKILGFEKNSEKAKLVNEGKNYIGDIEDKDLENVVKNKFLEATSDFSRINECDAVLICVPTPLDRFKKPDMSYIESACTEIGQNMRAGTFICLESTTYPTTTEDLMLPIIEKESGMKVEENFWLAFSPERVDPGNEEYKTGNTPKVLGAMTEKGKKIGMDLYSIAIKHMYPVSSPRVAEMVKILENTYRLVNISLINELALLSGKMKINIWEVIEAAKTKPYGFQAFYPGPGVGGHCIPLDPFYLEYIAKKFNFDLTMINTAGHLDNLMPHRMTIKISTALNKQKKPINGSKILFLGVAYKPDISDERESPALKIMDEVVHKGGEVYYHDPFISTVKTDGGRSFNSVDLTDNALENFDCIVITTKHKVFNFENIAKKAKLIVDLQNVYPHQTEKIYKL
jgi:UDP-N-acetyl-D-glucosamine dehydrogenase